MNKISNCLQDGNYKELANAVYFFSIILLRKNVEFNDIILEILKNLLKLTFNIDKSSPHHHQSIYSIYHFTQTCIEKFGKELNEITYSLFMDVCDKLLNINELSVSCKEMSIYACGLKIFDFTIEYISTLNLEDLATLLNTNYPKIIQIFLSLLSNTYSPSKYTIISDLSKTFKHIHLGTKI